MNISRQRPTLCLLGNGLRCLRMVSSEATRAIEEVAAELATAPRKLKRRDVIAQEKTFHAIMPPVLASTKKLGQLARQIAHKSLDSAITQMEFSPKKVAFNIANMLRDARQSLYHKQMTPERTFIDQAFVGKSDKMKEAMFRARGRTNIIVHRFSHLKVILKDQDTQTRRLQEKEQKLLKRKVWTQLSDRPVYNPKSYYLW